MKRRITIEQIQELTDEQQENLRDGWKPEAGEHVFCEKNGKEHIIIHVDDGEIKVLPFTDWPLGILNDVENYCLPLLDIGQMIELLGDSFAGIKRWTNTRTTFDVYYKTRAVEDIELCDALWEAVKGIL
jgi:hypothetical protein